MTRLEQPIRTSWVNKFRYAIRGAKLGVRGESSFFVHFFATVAVIAAAFVLQASLVEWCLLLLCITVVLTAEMFNSALERMARAITTETNPHIRDALDIGSGAALVAAGGAAVVGVIVFLHLLMQATGG